MKSSSSCFVIAIGCCLLAYGCGGDDTNSDDAVQPDGSTPDAKQPDARPGDAGLDSTEPDAPSLCDYTEQHDLTNDDTADPAGTQEATGLTLASRTTVCGVIDNTHFDGDITVDVDSYTLTVATAQDVLIRLFADAGAVEYVGVDVYSGPQLATYRGGNVFYGDHGVVAMHLDAGTYELQPFALDIAAPAAPIPYTVEIVTDTPDRCVAVTTGGYAEANDGPASIGNDVVAIPVGSPPTLTASTTDAPEATALVLGGTATRVTGTASVSTAPDQYADRDTYLVTTGATTELAVILETPVATADVDFLLFEAGSAEPVIRAISTTRPETRTFSVKPNTQYWLLVGAKVASTGLPAAYSATLCSASLHP